MLYSKTSLLLFLTLAVIVLCDDPFYVVIPKLDSNRATYDAINDAIQNAVADRTKIFRSNSDNDEIGTLYWWAPLNDGAKSTIAGTDGVRVVEDINILSSDDPAFRIVRRNLKNRHLAKRNIISQTDKVPYHLEFLCTAEGQDRKDNKGKYWYDDTAGSGIRHYIIDSGLRATHKEFKDYQLEWMFAGAGAGSEESDSESHGTSMASFAAGVRSGVAKKETLVAVKVDRSSPEAKKKSSMDWLDGLKQVYDQAKASYQGKAVVSMSLGWDQARDRDPQNVKDLSDALKDQYTKIIKALVNGIDVPVFSASGNIVRDPDDPTPDTVPSSLGGDALKDILVVVGGTGTDGGWVDYYNDADYVKIVAPTDDLTCATSASDTDYAEDVDGTSASTAMTAALCAYLMALGRSGADARATLYEKAHPRLTNPRTKAIIWNLVDSRTEAGDSGGDNNGDSVPHPPEYVDYGLLQCKPPHEDGDPHFYFNREGALDAAGAFCENQPGLGTVMGPGGTGLQESTAKDGHGIGLDISMAYVPAEGCPPTDFTRGGMVETCKQRFANTVDLCDRVVRSGKAWKQGGTFFRDCITWKLEVMGSSDG